MVPESARPVFAKIGRDVNSRMEMKMEDDGATVPVGLEVTNWARLVRPSSLKKICDACKTVKA